LNDRQKDGALFYGWIVIAITFICLCITFGIRSAIGAFVASWELDFSAGRSQITLVSGLCYLTFIFFQPVVGRATDQLGARFVLTASILLTGGGLYLSSLATDFWQLIITYGLIASIGMVGASPVTATAVVARWFEKKQGAVLGLVLSGMSVGQMVMGPLCIFLIDHYDWRFALSVLGLGILLVGPLCYFFLKSRPEDLGLLPYGAEGRNPGPEPDPAPQRTAAASPFSVFRNKIFWYLALPYFVCGFTDVGFTSTHFIPYAEGRGYSAVLIAAAYSLIAAANIAGTIGAGALSDRFNRSRLLTAVYWLRAAIFLLLFTLLDHPAGLLLFAVVYGLTERATITPTSSLCAHHFKDLSVGMVFGYVSIAHHLGGTLGSYIPGFLYDLAGSYVISFIIMIALLAGSGLMVARVADGR
jgi:sugar phosphate permease